MGIHPSTRVQAYQLNKGGVRARMAILRMIAADSANNFNPQTRLATGDWKGARDYTLSNWRAAFCGGLHQGGGQWYSHGGERFRGERFADECEGGPDHTGWFTNADGVTYLDGSGKARGIVGRLPHGRFIAGYHWGDTEERVYFPEVFDSARDAARMADEHARVFAESAREDSERFDAMTDAGQYADKARENAKMAVMARNVSPDHRDAAREALEILREALEALREATAAYEKGGA